MMGHEYSGTGKLPFGPHKGKWVNVDTKYKATESGKQISHTTLQALERVAQLPGEVTKSVILDHKFYSSADKAVKAAKARSTQGKGYGASLHKERTRPRRLPYPMEKEALDRYANLERKRKKHGF